MPLIAAVLWYHTRPSSLPAGSMRECTLHLKAARCNGEGPAKELYLKQILADLTRLGCPSGGTCSLAGPCICCTIALKVHLHLSDGWGFQGRLSLALPIRCRSSGRLLAPASHAFRSGCSAGSRALAGNPGAAHPKHYLEAKGTTLLALQCTGRFDEVQEIERQGTLVCIRHSQEMHCLQAASVQPDTCKPDALNPQCVRCQAAGFV